MKKYLYTRGLAPMAIVGVVAVVVIIGGGIYFATQDSGSDVGAPAGNSGDDTEGLDLSGDGSLRDLFLFSQNVTCTFSSSDEYGTSEGTVYVADRGERVRGDFIFTGGDGTTESHMIKRDNTSYFWSSDFEQGYAMPIPEDVDVPDVDTGPSGDGAPDFDSNVTYDCDSWNVDSDMFDLPSGVDFIDFGDSFGGAPDVEIDPTGGIDFSDQCHLCDQAPAGAAREKCLQAYGCN